MDLWIEALKQAPSLAVLVLIVAKFLATIKDVEQSRAQHDAEREERIAEQWRFMGNECHTIQQSSIKVMAELREEMGATREVQTSLLQALKK